MEVWKTINDYDGRYEVSNLGNVRSINYKNTGKAVNLKPATDTKGYLRVGFCRGLKVETKKVHRLVAELFIPNPLNLPQVNHINGNKKDNTVSNLEWCSNEQNNEHRAKVLKNKMSKDSCRNIAKGHGQSPFMCIETGKIYHTYNECMEDMGFKSNHISCVLLGKRPHTYGYHFKYVEDVENE